MSNEDSTIQEPQVEFLGREEAAQYLTERGVPVTYYALTKAEGVDIPFYKFGKYYRYKKSDLDQWIEDQRAEIVFEEDQSDEAEGAQSE